MFFIVVFYCCFLFWKKTIISIIKDNIFKFFLILKKIIIFIICLISFSSWTKAFLWEDLWSNLYNNIDKWFTEMELKQYEYELSWQWKWIRENINKILKLEWFWWCIDKELDVSLVEEITFWWIKNLHNIISDECKNENGSVSISTLNGIQNIIKKSYEISKYKASEKTKQINNISRIWIYSDWSIENSPFDLITDLQNINKIIFTKKIVYKWEEYSSNDDLFEDLINNDPNSDWNDNSLNNLYNNLDWNDDSNFF